MSAKRATLPGKDALFGVSSPEPRVTPPPAQVRPEPAPDPPAEVAVEPVAVAPVPVTAASEAAPGASVAVGERPEAPKSAHVQLCVWVAPEVANEVDRARARLFMEHGLKATKSQIVEAILRPQLPDLDALVRLLGPE